MHQGALIRSRVDDTGAPVTGLEYYMYSREEREVSLKTEWNREPFASVRNVRRRGLFCLKESKGATNDLR